MAKITKRCVDSVGAKPERYTLWDDTLKGFGLLVLPTGVKSYVYKYRTKEGQRRQITIGQHGQWTPTKARQRAVDCWEIVRKGGDPLGNKQALLQVPTVGEVLDAYLASEAFSEKAASTRPIELGRIERHLRPLLGGKHVYLLTGNDIKKAFAAIRDGKTATDIKTRSRGRARVRGGPGAAKGAIDLLKSIFNWARKEDLTECNPCDDVSTGSTGTRDTILEDAEDYARLFQALDIMEAEKRIRAPVADAIRLIALTGCRRGEAAGLLWRHVDLKQGRIVLPPASHKTGKITGKPRIINLPAVAQAIIAKQPQTGPDDFVFQPARGNGAVALSKAWRKVRAEADLPAGFGLHGLRHSLASHLAMGGAQAAEIMTALGHGQLSTSQRYVHWAESARSTLAEKAASVALAGMAKASDGASADVVKLRRGK